MLSPTTETLHHFTEALPSDGPFRLSHVTLDIPDSQTAIFRAQLHGPTGSQVWARAWLSNELNGTLAETESSPQTAGTDVVLMVNPESGVPEIACMRIESPLFATKHVIQFRLANDQSNCD